MPVLRNIFICALLVATCLSTTASDLTGARPLDAAVFSQKLTNQGVPAGIVHIDESVPELLWVNLKSGELYRISRDESGQYHQSAPIPISLGKDGYHKRKEGDLRTPVGVYHITSYLDDHQLDAKYGRGAFPVNYPSAYDRIKRRTGSGIWLHGLPHGVTSRPLLDSDGCVVVDNQTMDLLKPELLPRETMIVLGEELTWRDEVALKHQNLMDAISTWKEDWESLNSDQYFGHYNDSFTDLRRSFNAWKRYKRRVNGNKKWIKVDMERLSAIVHPEQSNLVSVRYYQKYRSSNYNWQGWKHMLWEQQSDGQWRIVYEGN